MQSLDPLPSHQSSPSHQAHQHEPPKCQIFNNQSNPMPNLLHEAGSQTISFAQWQPCTRRSSTWGMNVSYLSCCVEEKQNAFNMLKEELCTSRSFPSALSSLYLEKQTQCRTGARQEVQQTEPKHRNQHSSIPIADYILSDYGSDHNRRILNSNNNRCREIRKKNTKGWSVEETRLTGEAQGA